MKIEHSSIFSYHGEITLYTITNDSGASVTLSTVGAGIVAVNVPDRDGNLADVALGYDNPVDYFYDGPCAGKIPGRYANRIAEGRLVVDGRKYQLAVNNGPNALHGGPEGSQNRIWNARVEGCDVIFSRLSPDGEENYPGTLYVEARYSWSNDNTLTLEISAATENSPTVVNLTNHC